MFDNLCPEDTMVLANAIALSLYPGKTADELNVLGNLIVAVGSLLLTAAAQKQALSSQQTNAGESMDCTPSEFYRKFYRKLYRKFYRKTFKGRFNERNLMDYFS